MFVAMAEILKAEWEIHKEDQKAELETRRQGILRSDAGGSSAASCGIAGWMSGASCEKQQRRVLIDDSTCSSAMLVFHLSAAYRMAVSERAEALAARGDRCRC